MQGEAEVRSHFLLGRARGYDNGTGRPKPQRKPSIGLPKLRFEFLSVCTVSRTVSHHGRVGRDVDDDRVRSRYATSRALTLGAFCLALRHTLRIPDRPALTALCNAQASSLSSFKAWVLRACRYVLPEAKARPCCVTLACHHRWKSCTAWTNSYCRPSSAPEFAHDAPANARKPAHLHLCV